MFAIAFGPARAGTRPAFLAALFSLLTLSLTAAAASTTDHTKFKVLEGPFETGPQVTKACLSCHTEAAKQVHKTKHWTWSFDNPATGQKLGKRNVINNFCIATESNQAGCSSCHTGYGWKAGQPYDYGVEENVDCLVCHDTTESYDRKAEAAGTQRGLEKIAASVGRTSRATCGTCHFKGGGGKAVKHGDLDPTMASPDIFVDVHMDRDGLNFTCSTCHTTDAHMVSGSRYMPTAKGAAEVVIPGKGEQSRASCQACHGGAPHREAKLNDHTDRLACPTCHVPEFARGDFATKIWWDWSTAGRMGPDGKPIEVHDANGDEIYNSKKGDFLWGRDVVPGYVWFDGNVTYTLPGDHIDPTKVVDINRFGGGADDPDARIWPVKVMRGKQPYDAGKNTMVTPHTTGPDGFWTTFDWASAVEIGTRNAKVPYSGRFGFVETRMMWPIAHMVTTKEQSLKCGNCHAADGRMADIPGLYVPGRDRFEWLDWIGWAAAAATLAGVLGHAALRMLAARFRR